MCIGENFQKCKTKALIPFFDITSSGITEDWDSVEPNKNRIGDVIRDNNFGMISIEWDKSDPELVFHIFDINGIARVEYKLKLSALTFQ